MLRRLLLLVAVALLVAPAAAQAAKADLSISAADPSATAGPGEPADSGRQSWSLVRDRWYEVSVSWDVSTGSARNAVLRGRGTGVDVKPRRLGKRVAAEDEGLLTVPIRLTEDRARLQLIITSKQGRLDRQVIELTAIPEPDRPQDGLWAGTATALEFTGTAPVMPVTFAVRDGRVVDFRAGANRTCGFEDVVVDTAFPSTRVQRIGVLHRVATSDGVETDLELRFPSPTTVRGIAYHEFAGRCSGSSSISAQWTAP